MGFAFERRCLLGVQETVRATMFCDVCGFVGCVGSCLMNELSLKCIFMAVFVSVSVFVALVKLIVSLYEHDFF